MITYNQLKNAVNIIKLSGDYNPIMISPLVGEFKLLSEMLSRTFQPIIYKSTLKHSRIKALKQRIQKEIRDDKDGCQKM